MGRVLARYVLLEILRTFGIAILVFALIFLVSGLYEFLHQTYSIRQILLVIPYVLVYTLPFLVPVALLVGCSLAYGRLAADNELLPIMTGGIPLASLAWPAVLLGLVLTSALYGLEGSIIPYGWLKKKDVARAYVEQLRGLEGEDLRPISNEDDFHFFARRASGGRIYDIEIVSVPSGGGAAVLNVPGSGLDRALPAEIQAKEGRIEFDELHDVVRFELTDVTFTLFVPEAEPPTRAAQPEDLPPRGTPHHGRFAHFTVERSMDRKLHDDTEFRSSRYLHAYMARLRDYGSFAEREDAQARASVPPAAALASSVALPGAGPGAGALALAGLAEAHPGSQARYAAQEHLREAGGYLDARATLALAPLLFAIVGSAVPLLFQHPNRLLPFFLSFAIVACTFYLPWLCARSLVEEQTKLPGLLYWSAPLFTFAAGAALLSRVLRK